MPTVRKPGGYYKRLNEGEEMRIAEASLAISQDDVFDSGGVEANLEEWFGGILEEAMVMSEDEPSLEEAMKGDEAPKWITAMREEITHWQIEKVHTYDIIETPPEAN